MGNLLANDCENLELWQGLRHCFDPKARLYQHHALVEENAILLESCPNNFDPEERKWRDSLDVNSVLDAVKIEPLLEVRCWSRAKVIKKILPD